MSEYSWTSSIRKLSLPLGLILLGWGWYQHFTRSMVSTSHQIVAAPEIGEPPADDLSQRFKSHTPHVVSNDISPSTTAAAQDLIDRGDYQAGVTLLEQIIQRDPSNTQAMMELAMVYTLDLKAPVKARQLLEKIIDVNPQHRAALNELELIYSELGSSSDGLAFLQLKAEQFPDSLELQYVCGRMLAASDPAAAIPWLQRATKIPDLREQVLSELAINAMKTGNVQLAVDSWTEALRAAEAELELAKASNKPGIDFIEERIATSRSELLKAKASL